MTLALIEKDRLLEPLSPKIKEKLVRGMKHGT